jgi:hypothetical protein
MIARAYRAFLLSGLLLMVLLTVFLVSACGGPSGSSGSTDTTGCNLTLDELNNIGSAPPECLALLPDPVSTLNPRIFILGSETDLLGNLHIYVHGVDAGDVPLELNVYQNAAVVTVDGTVLLDNGADVNGGGVTVQALVDGSPISLAFLTDYSASISAANLDQIGQAYTQILNALPPGFEAEVLNFSDFTDVRQDWSQNLPALLSAVAFDPDFVPRNNTAFYDGIGNTLDRLVDHPEGGFGLGDRCRPARILVSHTDGLENASFTYTKGQLLTRIDESRVIPVMLGTLTANVTELAEFAGDTGAYVYAYDVNGINAAVSGWASSFGNIVEFVIDAGIFNFNTDVPGKVEIGLGALSAMVEAPYDQPCIPLP